MIPIFVIGPLTFLAAFMVGLYQPRRDHRFQYEAFSIIKTVGLGVVITVVILSLFKNILFEGRHYSGWQFAIYACIAALMLLVWRLVFRVTVRLLRSRGWNLRHVAIIGTGRLGQVAYHTIQRNSWTGLTPAFFISHN